MTAPPARPAPPAPTWAPEWLLSEARRIAEPRVWRGVETQYASATTLLVDSHEEHDVLEQLLEASKPPLPHALARSPAAQRMDRQERGNRDAGRGTCTGAESRNSGLSPQPNSLCRW